MNTGPKINGFSKLYPVDDASQMNIARASVVTHPTRCHDRLIHGRRAIKRDCARSIGESRHDHGAQTGVQRDQYLGIVEVLVVALGQLMLEIDNPLAGCPHLSKVG